MGDETAQPKSKKKLLIGAGAGGVLLLVSGFAILAVTVERVRTPWCKSVGLFCKKAPVVAAVAKPAPVPGDCPGPKMRGTMRGREAASLASTILADTEGRVTLDRDGWTATGRSSVTCSGNAFLATFDNMSQRMTYQCMGTVEGKTYSGTCTISDGIPQDISGGFSG